MHVLMAAAENDALPGLKVGGVADVVRDLPPALAALGVEVTVLCPAYGLLDTFAPLREHALLEVPFGTGRARVRLFEVDAAPAGVHLYLAEHPDFAACGRGAVYCDDGPGRPFATDASKFALFCAAVAEALLEQAFGPLDAVHLHDWHTALVLVLRRFAARYRALVRLRTVYTIHNLGLQGVRPLGGDPSSLEAWFPGLGADPALIGDPRWPECVNPMAAAIRLADAVGTVSPGYAREILTRGEGLEADLGAANARGALTGILNGCPYPGPDPRAAPEWPALCARMRAHNLAAAGRSALVDSACYVAGERLAARSEPRPSPLLTTVGRVTAQKLGLLRAPVPGAASALDAVLDAIGEGGLYVVLGSGDPELEQFLVATSARRANLVYLRGYAPAIADGLYARGELFLMPSSYEPCGISQMLAMRAGQPCLVHAVGGLADTVRDGETGFSFAGPDAPAQAAALVARLREALSLREREPARWEAIAAAARAARFTWSESARGYRDRLYAAPRPSTRAGAHAAGQASALAAPR